MIFELDRKDYPKAENLFNRLKANTAIESIFNFKNEARLFVDNISNPESVFVLNSWAYYYLAGDSENTDFNTSLIEFLENDFFPESIKNNCNTSFAFYPDSEEWSIKIEEIFSHLNLQKSGKTYFNFNRNRFNKNWRESIPEGFSIKRIDQDIVDSIKDNKEFVDYIKFAWTTLDSYFEKGLGYCAVTENDFAAICISVFASENEREVGIKTFPGYQRKGLAYLTASAYIEECLMNDLIPVWSCFSENAISIKLAEKIGFKIEASHPIYFAQIAE